MTEPISSASFVLLSDSQKKELFDFFEESPTSKPYEIEKTLQSFIEYIKDENARKLLKAKNPRPGIFYLHDQRLIHQTNPAMFKYMDENEREALKGQLILAFYGLCDRYLLNIDEDRKQNRLEHFAEIEKCSFLIRNIIHNQKIEELEEKIKSANHNDAGLQRCKREKAEQLEFFDRDFSAGKTVYLRQWMSDFNIWRLYWIWAGNLMRVSLGLIPNNFYNKQQTVNVVTDPQPILGHISYILYYTRFLVNFLLVLKHTIRGPWMSEEEKKAVREIGTLSRLQQQLAIRKFTLLNDIIWATTNLLCFFWLVGPSLGFYGDILATLLLVADASICLWARQEATKEHKENILLYEKEINNLEEELEKSKDKEQSEEEQKNKQKQLAILKYQKEELELTKEKCEQDWVYKKQKANVDLIYGLVLILSFSAIAFPWAATTALGMTVGGSVGLFLATLIYSCYKAYIDVSKAQSTEKSALEQCKNILTKYTESNVRNHKEKSYLRYLDLRAEADYQVKLANYHFYTLVRTGIVQALLPLAIFAAFTFASFGIAAAVIAATIIIAIITHYIVESQKPQKIELNKFNNDEFKKLDIDKEKSDINTKLNKFNRNGSILFSTKQQDEYQDVNDTSDLKKI